jgi:hypothetical protein
MERFRQFRQFGQINESKDNIQRDEYGDYIGDEILVFNRTSTSKILKPKKAGKLIKSKSKLNYENEEWDQECSVDDEYSDIGYHIIHGSLKYKNKDIVQFSLIGIDDYVIEAYSEVDGGGEKMFLEFVQDIIRDENNGELPEASEKYEPKKCTKINTGLYGINVEYFAQKVGNDIEYGVMLNSSTGFGVVATPKGKIESSYFDIDRTDKPYNIWFLLGVFDAENVKGKSRPEIEVSLEDAEFADFPGFALGETDL